MNKEQNFVIEQLKAHPLTEKIILSQEADGDHFFVQTKEDSSDVLMQFVDLFWLIYDKMPEQYFFEITPFPSSSFPNIELSKCVYEK